MKLGSVLQALKSQPIAEDLTLLRQ